MFLFATRVRLHLACNASYQRAVFPSRELHIVARDSRFEACCNISLQLLLSRCKRAFAVKVGVLCRGKGQCSRGERTVLKEFSVVTRTHIPQLHSATLFSHNYYVVWARRYCDQSVTVYVCVYVGVWFCVSTIKRKPMIGMT